MHLARGSVRNSCLYCSVGKKMAFLQSSQHLSLAPVSAGGHISGCTFRKKLLIHLSMLERRLGKRTYFFQVTVMGQLPLGHVSSEYIGAAFGKKFS